MKQNLLKSFAMVAATLFCTCAFAQTETITASHDGVVRSDNSSANYDLAANSHIELKHGTKNDADIDFYGLLSFSIPEKEGCRVSSASLRFVSKMIKTNRQTGFYLLNADVVSKPKYADIIDAVNAALETAPIGQVKAEGNNGKQVTSDNNIDDKYLTIASWTNTIELDASKITTGQDLNLLVAIIGDRAGNDNANRFFGINAADFTNPNYETLSATNADVVPQLTLTYEEATNSNEISNLPTADLWVRSDNAGKVNGTGNIFEIKSDMTEGAEKYFYGLLSFNLPTPADDEEIESASLRLTTRVERGDRQTAIRTIDVALDENATNYTMVQDQIATALQNEPIATFKMEGHNNKAITDKGLDAKYQMVSAWQHHIDITEHLKNSNSVNLTLLISKENNTGSNSSAFFTKEATDLTWNAELDTEVAGTTIAAADLVPQLTIIYKKKGTETGIDTVERRTIHVNDGIYTLSGQRVERMVKGIYIVNGKKILIK